MFKFKNDMCTITENRKYDKCRPLVFKNTSSVVQIDALLGINEISMLFPSSKNKNEQFLIPTYFVGTKLFILSPNFGWIACEGNNSVKMP